MIEKIDSETRGRRRHRNHSRKVYLDDGWIKNDNAKRRGLP